MPGIDVCLSCPLLITLIHKHSWKVDTALLCPMLSLDITNYFVYSISVYTVNRFKPLKSLESQGHLTWVQDLLTVQPEDCNNTVIKSSQFCLRNVKSQKKLSQDAFTTTLFNLKKIRFSGPNNWKQFPNEQVLGDSGKENFPWTGRNLERDPTLKVGGDLTAPARLRVKAEFGHHSPSVSKSWLWSCKVC